jgi:hypothetical protein
MTTPNTGAPDVPLATVPYGKSELLMILMAVASMANAVLGKDYGLTKNAQAISAAGAVLIPIALQLIRALRHKSAIHANAAVITALIAQGAYAVTGQHAAPADPVTEPALDLPQPPDVGLDLPVESVSTVLPAA